MFCSQPFVGENAAYGFALFVTYLPVFFNMLLWLRACVRGSCCGLLKFEFGRFGRLLELITLLLSKMPAINLAGLFISRAGRCS